MKWRFSALFLCVFSLFFSLFHGNIVLAASLTVHNIDTGLSYTSIQEAIDAPETLDGHTILVDAGVYYEHVVVNKAVSLIGESRDTTIVDGNGTGNIFHIIEHNATIKNFKLTNGDSGFVLRNRHSDNCTIMNNTVVGFADSAAIECYGSNHTRIDHNNFTGNMRGISLDGSDCHMTGNIFADNKYEGIHMTYCRWSVFRSNVFVNNGFELRGRSLDEFMHDIDVSNTINGRPIYYLINQRDIVIDASTHPEIGFLALVNSENVEIRNIECHSFGGILLAYTTNSTIKNSNITGCDRGIMLERSNNNTITGNTLKNNGWGVALLSSRYNIISENTIEENGGGITLAAKNNIVYHNNFADNTRQAVDSGDGTNIWDDGIGGGNYWSDYAGVDWYGGFYQNETGSDGLGDTPYIIDGINRDRYPLMKPYPWSSHDIGITRIATSKTILGQGLSLQVSVSTFNYGNNPETFNLTAYANTTAIACENATLPSRNSTTLAFHWNTAGFAIGNYTISAYATPVLGETDTIDNIYINGMVRVRSPIHNIAVTNVAPSKPVVGQGCYITINITVENPGDYTENFNVTAYYDSTFINSTKVTDLLPSEETTITFTWNTTTVAKDNYTITGVADTVPGETDSVDNNDTCWVIVSIIGDLTGPDGWPDGTVDMRDIGLAAQAFGSYPGHDRWNPDADITGPEYLEPDNNVDMRDIALIARHFGDTDP